MILRNQRQFSYGKYCVYDWMIRIIIEDKRMMCTGQATHQFQTQRISLEYVASFNSEYFRLE